MMDFIDELGDSGLVETRKHAIARTSPAPTERRDRAPRSQTHSETVEREDRRSRRSTQAAGEPQSGTSLRPRLRVAAPVGIAPKTMAHRREPRKPRAPRKPSTRWRRPTAAGPQKPRNNLLPPQFRAPERRTPRAKSLRRARSGRYPPPRACSRFAGPRPFRLDRSILRRWLNAMAVTRGSIAAIGRKARLGKRSDARRPNGPWGRG